MRYALLSMLLLASSLFADEAAKPNTLTPKEIAEGWLLMFDGQSTFGWEVIDGEVVVQDGMLKMEGNKGWLRSKSAFMAQEFQYEVSEDGKSWRLLRSQYVPMKGTPFRPKTVQLSPEKPQYFRSVKLLPKGAESLFNGKDLKGWKVFPGAKDRKVASEFTVTKEGWLNVKNGPGDLQTEGQWADFVVQLECISNGKHLNSGLFFRCIPDLYQQGYEAQIRNEWMGDDRTKPIDFGTGAIYRRQAARKVVSTDGEWFTMTIAAHGKHLATWVNGEQVASWTDDRKEADNGRNGAKTSKGALSIQGHDPTTDLSFRNIRIQSLDKK